MSQLNTKTARIAAIVATTGVVLFGATTATAGGSPTIPDGSVWQADIAKPVNDLYLKTQNNSVGDAQLKPEVATKLELGKGKVMMSPSIKIPKIGGPFLDRKTFLGDFRLEPGAWLVTSNATFNRTVAALPTDTKTRPQLALRYDETDMNQFGDTAGTIMGVDISPTVGRELMGATVQTIYLSKTTTIKVYAFGYNDDNSQVDNPGITVRAQITATKIG